MTDEKPKARPVASPVDQTSDEFLATLPETPLSRALDEVVRRLESVEWPKPKKVPDVDWEELIRTHPAFKHFSPGA